jgi:hypothetical protein
LEILRIKSAPYGRYRMRRSTDATIFTSYFAVFVRNLFGDLESLTGGERNQWIELISDCQEEKTGLFTDARIFERKLILAS